MTDTQKVEKVKALMGEIEELSAELSEDELEQVAGGGVCICALGGDGQGNDHGSKLCSCETGGEGTNDEGIRCGCHAYGFGADLDPYSGIGPASIER
ncbi:MAG: hypothetical protein LBL86_06775 [Coriobacteriales bacterium]|nr:hypothetical protein [Coriobacteriales bacterium]